MLTETITYEDFNGIERKEDFFFNLTEAELLEMELSTSGGYAELLTKIVEAKDTPSLARIFKELILKAYGEKSPDGKYFVKSEEISERFSQTNAYSQLYMKLALDANKAADFVNGLIPANLSKKVKESGKLLENIPVSALPTAE